MSFFLKSSFFQIDCDELINDDLEVEDKKTEAELASGVAF